MNRYTRALVIAAMLGMVAIPTHRAVAQTTPQYTLIDLGTLGGPNSFVTGASQIIGTVGTVVGAAETSVPDPYTPACSDSECLISHAAAWRGGGVTDLGALPGVNNSFAFWTVESGMTVGFSQNGVIDPLTGFPEERAVLWGGGKTVNLGTLGGYESFAASVNNRGQVTGIATNTAPDPYSLFGWNAESRPFLWQDGQMRDLGSLGGPDGIGQVVNESGQVAGESSINSVPDPVTGTPVLHPFLWTNGRMRDLGTLGGSLLPSYGIMGLNNSGEVVGPSYLAGDQTFHPFLWNGRTMLDLGTFGGAYGIATWLNDAGHVVGWATTPGNAAVHAFMWQNGHMTDLGVLPGDQCDSAWGINAQDQVIGDAGFCGQATPHPFLWEHGSMYDLNTLIPPSNLHLVEANYIDDRGEIAGFGVLPNGDQHAFLLVPVSSATSGAAAQTARTIAASACGTTHAGPTASEWVNRASNAGRYPIRDYSVQP